MIRFLTAAAVLLMLAIPAVHAQPPDAFFYYLPNWISGPQAPLTTECPGVTPIPDGWIVRIFQDIDSDGPDSEDPQPTVCDVPPACESGPTGTVSYNEFLMNGSAVALGAGYFVTEYQFTSSLTFPPGANLWYLRVYASDGTTILWTSTVFPLDIGYQEIVFEETDWTCGSSPECVVIDETE